MAVPQQKFREIVFQMLYGFDMGHATDENLIDLLSQELEVSKKTVKEAQRRLHQIRSHLPEIDAKIAATSHSYAFERIQAVERNILRIATYELLYDPSIPFKVAIAEAMRLAKKFSTPESATFVNAILDAIHKTRLGEDVDLLQLKTTAQELIRSEEIAHEAALNKKEDNEAS